MDLTSIKGMLSAALMRNDVNIIPPEADAVLATMSSDEIVDACTRINAEKVNTVEGVMAILKEYKNSPDEKKKEHEKQNADAVLPVNKSFSITLDDKEKAPAVPQKTEATAKPKVKPLSNAQVTEHTAALWKYNPIPENEPEKHEEYHTKHFESSFFEVIAARARGKKHKHEGTNCDDWFEIAECSNWLCCAVSDGAGSKKFSRIGARIACETATSVIKREAEVLLKANELIEEMLSEPLSSKEFMTACGMIAPIVQLGVTEAAKAVTEEFEKQKKNTEFTAVLGRELSPTDFSCTLLVMLAVPLEIDGKKERFMVTVQVGDGMIAAINTDAEYEKALKLLGEADSGDFSGETEFITSAQMIKPEKLMKKTRITRGSSDYVLMMSDGVADDYFPCEPQMKRLFLDLAANGIIPIKEHGEKFSEGITVPEPVVYQWVNDPSVKIPLQYTKNVMEKAHLNLEQLWNSSDLQNRMSLSAFEWSLSDNDACEALKVWIDNYVERGSFDDRTLAIIKCK